MAWLTVDAPTWNGTNLWPSSLSRATIKKLDRYYPAMPEVLYSKTQWPVITPDVAEIWLHAVRSVHTFDVQELKSGSSTLTYGVVCQGRRAAFPIDYR